MQDDLYPPGMAPASGTPAEPKPRPKLKPQLARPATVRPADLLPPGAAEPTPHIDDAAAELGDLLPEPALPPEADANMPSPSQIAASRPAPLELSTAPSAARVAKNRDRQSQRLLLLTVLGAGAIATLLGVGYVFIKPQNRPTAVVEQRPTRRQPAPRPPNDLPRPSKNVSRPAVPPVVRANDPQFEDSPSEPVASFIPVSPPPMSEPLPTPLPAPKPPPLVTVSRTEVEQLVQALEAGKTALGEANFQAADASLMQAETLAKLPRHQESVSRLKEIRDHVKKFHDGVKAAAQSMQAGETFKVGTSTQVAFVEAKPDRIVLRLAGMNKTYLLADLPPGLALAIAEFKLPATDPASNIAKGAYLLVHKRADTETREKAESLWQQAEAAGPKLSSLWPFLSENYQDLRKDASD